jgi:hypothetical protein
MKFLITENQMRRLEFKYLNYLFDGMYEVESEEYPDSRFWKKDNEVVLELQKSGKMWVYYVIWDNFSGMFSLEDNETQQVLKKWLEEHLNLEGITPQRYMLNKLRWRNI